ATGGHDLDDLGAAAAMLAHLARKLFRAVRDGATPGAIGPCGIDAVARVAVAAGDGDGFERDDDVRPRDPATIDVMLESEIDAAVRAHVAHSREAFEQQLARHR